MTQQLGELAALAEDFSVGPSDYIVSHNHLIPVPGYLPPWPPWLLHIHKAHTYLLMKHPYT